MLASENGALPGCKVGGIADVLRDLPPELVRQGCEVSVVTPSYGFLHEEIEGASLVKALRFQFASKSHQAFVYSVPVFVDQNINVNYFVIDSPLIFKKTKEDNGCFRIYFDDPPDRPFETDALKFAFFCRAAAESIKSLFSDVDCIHLHDWHCAFLLILSRYHPRYSFLRRYRTVFTVHNLAIQGIRPFKNCSSSLESWYPDMKKYDRDVLSDPKWRECINPMAAGIRLADRVHTVSPSYASEILKPGRKPLYYGGEGLEKDLQSAKQDGRLFGILNGCDYVKDDHAESVKMRPLELMHQIKKNVLKWSVNQDHVCAWNFLAVNRLTDLSSGINDHTMIVTSIGRMVEQKYHLLKTGSSSADIAVWKILECLKGRGVYIMLGTGDRLYEEFFMKVSAQVENFVFLNSYSEECADMLYARGDLFLMPSLYEPCGLSQMIAMSYGQPCLVHGVGGLKNTVKQGVNGFVFAGRSIREKVDNFEKSFNEAVFTRENEPEKWKLICSRALAARFLWKDSVREYIANLYRQE